jgi:serine protease
MNPRTRPAILRAPVVAVAVPVMLLLVVVGAQQVTTHLVRGTAATNGSSPFSVAVDPGVAAPVPELPGRGGVARRVAALVDADGNQAEFVVDELVLTTDDESQLEAFLARWDGEVVTTFDPAESDLPDLPTHYLVRVDASPADPATLVRHLDRFEREHGGPHRVSSEAALRLLAAASGEAAAGLAVEVNWVGRQQDFRDRTAEEAPTAYPPDADRYPGPNAFTWTTHSTGSEQDIGVAEAWRVLDLAGRLDNTVRIAIVDRGFRLDEDTPAGWQAVSVDPAVDPIDTPGPFGDPWHGHRVASAAMAVADNGFGGAGPGGPVAEPLLIRTAGDAFTTIQGLAEARRAGADIVNMSFGVVVPGKAVGTNADSLRNMIEALRREGTLVFAAAGNSGLDVDARKCYLRFFCRERTTVVPCEFTGVICVGGLAWDSKWRHPDSNYGARDVDIFAPFDVWVGASTTDEPNLAALTAGTSFSAPFAAGVAALVWAANPGLTGDEVERVLLETAHTSPDATAGRYVNALAAVLAAANLPPQLTVHRPDGGALVPLNVPVTFVATADDYEDGEFCCEISWLVSNFTGIRIPMGAGERVTRTFTAPGRYTVEVTARDSGGATDVVRLAVEAVNTPPEVEITRPAPGVLVPRGTPYLVRATAADPDEPGGRVDCARLRWTSSDPADPFPVTGCGVEVTFPTAGPRTLTVTATDSHDATGTASVRVNVSGAPPDAEAPTVRIISPHDGGTILNQPGGLQALRWEGTDPAGGGLSHQWSVGFPYDPATGAVGTTETITEREIIYPSPWIAWRPFDNLGEVYCDLAGGPVRVSLLVTDATGRSATDSVVLHTQPCLIVG